VSAGGVQAVTAFDYAAVKPRALILSLVLYLDWQIIERHHEECLLVAQLTHAERAEEALVQQRLAELRALQEKVGGVVIEMLGDWCYGITSIRGCPS
jgi:hypothetical protein